MYDFGGKASKRHQLLFHGFVDLRMRKQDLVRYMVLLVCAESFPKLSLHLEVMCLCRWCQILAKEIGFDYLMSGVWFMRGGWPNVSSLAFSSLLESFFPSCFSTACQTMFAWQSLAKSQNSPNTDLLLNLLFCFLCFFLRSIASGLK